MLISAGCLGCELSRYDFYPFPFEQRRGHPVAFPQLSFSLYPSASTGRAVLLQPCFFNLEPPGDLQGGKGSAEKTSGYVLPFFGNHRGIARQNVLALSPYDIHACSGNGQSSQNLRTDGNGLSASHQFFHLFVLGAFAIVLARNAAEAGGDQIWDFSAHGFILFQKTKKPRFILEVQSPDRFLDQYQSNTYSLLKKYL